MLYLNPVIVVTPNRSERARLNDVKCIVVHATAGNEAGSVAWLTNKDSKVSADVVISKTGKLYWLNPDPARYFTWHAGLSQWKNLAVNGRTLNPVSIGIELVNANDGKDPYTTEQYIMLSKVVRWYRETFNIAVENIVRHSDVAPGRKTDPAGFQWECWKALACGELR